MIGNSEFKLWLRYKRADLDSFTFNAGMDEEVTIDLVEAQEFCYGDTKHLPPDLLRGFKVADSVRVKNGDLDVTVLLSS